MSTSASDRHFKNRWFIIFGIVLTLGFAQTPWGLSLLGRWVLHANKIEFTFASLHGFWMNSLEVRGIEGSVGGYGIEVDTAQVHLSRGSLLRGRIRLRHLELKTPIVHFRGMTSEAQADPVNEAKDPSLMDLPWIESLHIQKGRFHMEDQMLEISGIQVQGKMSPGAIEIDTLYGDVFWQRAALHLSAVSRWELNQGLFQIDTLLLRGPNSKIHAYGSWGRQTNLEIMAAPLSRDVLTSLIPAIDEDLMVRVELKGEGDSLRLAFDGTSENGRALTVRGSTRMDTPSVYVDTLRFEQLDPRYLFTGLTGELTGLIRGHLDGESWDALSGKMEGHLGTGILSGVPVESARMSGDMEDGAIQVQLDSKLALGSLGVEATLLPSSASGQLRGQFKNLNARAFGPQYESTLNGNFTFVWEDSLEGYVEIMPGSMGTMGIKGGELRLFSKDELLQFTGGMRGDSARITLEADRQESGLMGRLEVDSLDVGALLNRQDLSSQISLTLESMTSWPQTVSWYK